MLTGAHQSSDELLQRVQRQQGDTKAATSCCCKEFSASRGTPKLTGRVMPTEGHEPHGHTERFDVTESGDDKKDKDTEEERPEVD